MALRYGYVPLGVKTALITDGCCSTTPVHGFKTTDSFLSGFRVYTRGEWQNALKSAGKPWHHNELDVLSLRIPAESEELALVHAQTLSMGDTTVRGTPRLHLKSVPLTEKEIEEAIAAGTPREQVKELLRGRSAQPENISLPVWRTDVLAVMAEQDGRVKDDN